MTDPITILPTKDFQRLLTTLERLEKRLATIEAATTRRDSREWLNRKQAAEVLGFTSTTTVDAWVRRGWLTRYSDGNGRPRFKREEVVAIHNRKKAGQ